MAGGLMRFAYLDTAAAGASYVELAEISDDLKAMFADIRSRARAVQRI